MVRGDGTNGRFVNRPYKDENGFSIVGFGGFRRTAKKISIKGTKNYACTNH